WPVLFTRSLTMGFFSNLKYTLSAESKIQARLERDYIPIFHQLGLTLEEACIAFLKAFGRVKSQYDQKGIVNRPPNYGDRLLEQEKVDPMVTSALRKKRSEGVSDLDIRWWWNIHFLEQGIILEVEETRLQASYHRALREGMTPELASRFL